MNIFKKLGLVLLVFPVCFCLLGMESTTHQTSESAPLVNKIDEYMTACTELKKFNGTVLVAQAGKVLIRKGYGLADFEHHLPCIPTTKFSSLK